jgi:hypothetical protein
VREDREDEVIEERAKREETFMKAWKEKEKGRTRVREEGRTKEDEGLISPQPSTT